MSCLGHVMYGHCRVPSCHAITSPEHVVGDEPGEDEEAEHVALLHAHQPEHYHEKYLCGQKNIRTASSGEYKSINPISSSAVSLSSVYTQHLLSSWEWIKTSRGMCVRTPKCWTRML